MFNVKLPRGNTRAGGLRSPRGHSGQKPGELVGELVSYAGCCPGDGPTPGTFATRHTARIVSAEASWHDTASYSGAKASCRGAKASCSGAKVSCSDVTSCRGAKASCSDSARRPAAARRCPAPTRRPVAAHRHPAATHSPGAGCEGVLLNVTICSARARSICCVRARSIGSARARSICLCVRLLLLAQRGDILPRRGFL